MTPGADYDQLDVNGTVALGNALLTGGPVGAGVVNGNTFTILQATGAITGFLYGNNGTNPDAQIPGGGLVYFGGYSFTVQYLTNSVVLTVAVNPPTVTAISPTSGPSTGGTTVTITGTNFIGASSVMFGSVPAASFSVKSLTQIVAVSPTEGTGPVDVTVTTPGGGTSSTSSADKFTFTASPPTVTGLSPSSDSTSGGTTITITGTSFLGATSVTFGGVAGTNLIVNSASQITVVDPAHLNGTVDVRVTTASGTSPVTAADQFAYNALLPTVSSVSPNTDSPGGGTTITITGTNFFGASSVKFGTVAGTHLTVVSPTQITVVDPAEPAGQVDVTVTTPGGTSLPTANDHFTYVVPGPTVTNISPNTDLISGGSTITITGANLLNATSVTFGGTAGNIQTDTATQITVVDPAHAPGLVNVIVTTNPGGTITKTNAFTYVTPALPTVTSVSPNMDTTVGGLTITITGTSFTGVSAVDFGSTPATSFQFVSATQITAVDPASATAITVDVTVQTPGGTSTTSPADKFTYTTPVKPVVSALNPTSGPTSGGDTITITGTNLLHPTAVMFGTLAATNVIGVNSTTITAVDPAESVGTVDVTVSTAGGTSITSSADQFTYFIPGAPNLTGVSPNADTILGGTTIAITGTNLLNATSVSFGGAVVTNILTDTARQITVVDPAHAAGSVNLTVTTPISTSNAETFTYSPLAAPTVSSVNPTSGSTDGGDMITITGTNFIGNISVVFGTTPGTNATLVSSTQITVVDPAHAAGMVNVTVTTPGGTSATSSADDFTFVIKPPAVTVVSPSSGTTSGGTTVTISGVHFSGATSVLFGTVAATSFSVISTTQITAVSPAELPSTVDITVTTAGGTSTTSSADQYTYIAFRPVVSSLNPNTGPITGAFTVTITGANLFGATGVSFDGTAATNFTVNSPTQITATAPAHSAGVVDVTVTTAGGTSATSANDHFTYNVFPPTVTSISPSSGTTSGGTTVTINGTNLLGSTTVMFGSVAATSFTVVSTSQITAVTPPELSGVVNVTVTSAQGTSTITAADQYTYVAFQPVISSLNPATGTTSGGFVVTIIGTNFFGATAVSFGTTPATSFTVHSPTQITATAPPHIWGTVNVTVTAGGLSAASTVADQFVYHAFQPTVTSLSTTSGSTNGGATITITGTNFFAATVVSFGGVAASSFTVNSPTQITAIAPPHAQGTVDVQVTTPNPPSLPVNISPINPPADQFTYNASTPTLSSISVNAGITTGGTMVVIIGTNLFGATSVTFGGVGATSYTVNSATQITAVSPAEAAGTVDIRVTTAGGTTAITSADQFTYVAQPSVTGLSPNFGSAAGGYTVTVTGTNLSGASAVYFGSTLASSFTHVSNRQLTAVAPAYAVAPPNASITVNVTVVDSGSTSLTSTANQFSFVTAASVGSVTPVAGSTAGDYTVTIAGSNFSGATAVSFGSAAATSFTVNSAGSIITAVAPAHGPGTVDITVTTLAGASPTTSADHFTYVAPPTLTSLNISSGSTAGGYPVTITGTNFVSGSQVYFGNYSASSVTVNSATSITAIAPTETAATVDVTVNILGISTPIVPADHFTFIVPPTVTAISPTMGSTTGATTVTITGTNFTGASSVHFGGSLATFTINSATQITAISPVDNTPGAVDVTVTKNGITSQTSASDQFTYALIDIWTGGSGNNNIGTRPATGIPALCRPPAIRCISTARQRWSTSRPPIISR